VPRRLELRPVQLGHDEQIQERAFFWCGLSSEYVLWREFTSKLRRLIFGEPMKSRLVACVAASLVAMTLACVHTQAILETRGIASLKVASTPQSQILEISGMAMTSALAVSGYRVERVDNSLILLVSLVLARPELRPDFVIAVSIPPEVDHVLFGEERKEIWRRSQ
jgi:hypothetical protein